MHLSRRRRWTYPFAGLLLACGAPAGLFVLERALELGVDVIVYAYVTASTSFVFVILGVLLGRYEDRLHTLGVTDALTELPNRRQFAVRLGEELVRCERYDSPLSLLLIDVDGLKQINDTQGHSAGDQALRLVADSLRSASRAADLPARVAGDEFAVLAPMIRADEAFGLAERIRMDVIERVANESLHALGEVTVSVGVADTRGRCLDAGELSKRADRALYEAKSRGRNQVVVARGERPGADLRAVKAISGNFICPVHDEVCYAVFSREPGTDQWTGPTFCSHFDDGEVACEKECAQSLSPGRLPVFSSSGGAVDDESS